MTGGRVGPTNSESDEIADVVSGAPQLVFGRSGFGGPSEPSIRQETAGLGGRVSIGKVGRSMILQAKMQVGSANDPLERDADEIAAKFLNYSPGNQTSPTDVAARDMTRTARRAAAEQAPSAGAFEAPYSAEAHIEKTRGSGSALPGDFQRKMESMTGTDLSGVTLHTDAASAETATSLGALAFASGSDIYFGAGASPSDTKLLAHEVAHVVQQRSGGGVVAPRLARRTPASQAKAAPVRPAAPPAKVASPTQPIVPEATRHPRRVSAVRTRRIVRETAQTTEHQVASTLDAAVRPKRIGGLTPRHVTSALRPTVQSTCMSSVSAAPTEERLARALAVDIGLANAMRVATRNLPGFDPDSLIVGAGEMTFAPVDSVAKLASDPMPSGGLDRGGLR